MIFDTIPFDSQKNLGKAYNHTCKHAPEDSWIILRDYDTLILLPDTKTHIEEYVKRDPDINKVYTCFANRNHPTLPQQILGGVMSENTDINFHINLAVNQRQWLYQTTEIKGNIAGFFMLLNKRLWQEIKFQENFKSLGVDFAFCRALREKKKTILRMEGIYIWHTYRLQNGVNNKNHLL